MSNRGFAREIALVESYPNGDIHLIRIDSSKMEWIMFDHTLIKQHVGETEYQKYYYTGSWHTNPSILIRTFGQVQQCDAYSQHGGHEVYLLASDGPQRVLLTASGNEAGPKERGIVHYFSVLVTYVTGESRNFAFSARNINQLFLNTPPPVNLDPSWEINWESGSSVDNPCVVALLDTGDLVYFGRQSDPESINTPPFNIVEHNETD